jgi:DNA invertase Pin-like site-specific DNA recombinase
MKVAIYSRVSTIGKGQDTENQTMQLREFAAKQGWEVVAEYTDHESGSKSDRPQFQTMLKAASQRKFDLLLFWSLDRLSREGVLPTLNYLNQLTNYGVGYRSFTEQYFDSCGVFRDAVISILATVARQERIRISERVRAGIARRKSQGKTFGGRAARALDMSEVVRLRAEGADVSTIARSLKVSPSTLYARLSQV